MKNEAEKKIEEDRRELSRQWTAVWLPECWTAREICWHTGTLRTPRQPLGSDFETRTTHACVSGQPQASTWKENWVHSTEETKYTAVGRHDTPGQHKYLSSWEPENAVQCFKGQTS
jgi:hypothetical protein